VMSTLVSITSVDHPTAQVVHRIHHLPVLVIFPHNQCNCRCVMCDIWRIREAKQITPSDLEQQMAALRELGVRWAVFSGGEPQLNEKWGELAKMLRAAGSRVTLLTAGLLLKTQAQTIADCVDDVIVSLDGPPALHNSIRRVSDASERIAEGVAALRQLRPDMQVGARCTVQKANHHLLRATVAHAKRLELTSISFLAADLTSSAFNRPEGWRTEHRDRVALTSEEVDALEIEIDQLIREDRINAGFVLESPAKLRRIVQHFRAHLGQASPVAPRCNAPWVSAVIEASGDVRPCFFHPVIGNIHSQALSDIINSPEALNFRASLDVDTNAVCRQCVCSLHLSQQHEPTKH
jgi:MoaA/NifB/PqqE/SkfB family radical SAM enzyme